MPFSHRRWIPLNPRYLAGVILKDTLAPPLPQPASEEEPKRFKQTKRSIGKTQLESALFSTFLIGPHYTTFRLWHYLRIGVRPARQVCQRPQDRRGSSGRGELDH